MNFKKLLFSVVLVVIMAGVILMPNTANALVQPDASGKIYMGILTNMEWNEDTSETMAGSKFNMGYAINTPGSDNAAKIWNIVKYKTESAGDYDLVNFYCVKAGVGFAQPTEGGGLQKQSYNVSYDMKTQKDAIAQLTSEEPNMFQQLVQYQINEGGTQINRYSALLAALDMLYLPVNPKAPVSEDKTAQANAQKENLLNTIIEQAKTDGKYTSYINVMKKYPLTDNDIVAVQQAAIWYFTNYEDETKKFDQTQKTGWLNYTADAEGSSYQSLTNYTAVGDNVPQEGHRGLARSYQAEILYNYIINQAKANAKKYENASVTQGAPATVQQATMTYELNQSKDRYIVGPIKIQKNNESALTYTIDFIVKSKGSALGTSEYYILKDKNTKLEEGKTVKELVEEGNQEFYISIPKNKLDSLTIDININYNNTVMKLWTSTESENEQPLVELEKNVEKVPTTLSLAPETPFDLALRKYITAVNDTNLELSEDTKRSPSIDAIAGDATTATYKHRKDPVLVKKGDKVTYKLTVYNEGQKIGRATKIIDQLPVGLEFKRVVDGYFIEDPQNRYNKNEDNRLYLVRDVNHTENLAAYTGGVPASETITIECEVTATPDEKNTKILTNVAWISEEYNAVNDETITNQNGADRDSEPLTTPKSGDVEVDKNNMTDYKGNTSNNSKDLANKNNYFEGQQDDDDFEKLKLLPESFDLKLVKYISEINGQDVPSRIDEENIDVSELNRTDENGNIKSDAKTTAEYPLTKDPIAVKKGDIVTYTFRIYNEGTLDGYAEKITEDVPEGLEFIYSIKDKAQLEAENELSAEEIEAIEFNKKYLWGEFKYNQLADGKTGDRIIEISSNYLSSARNDDNLIQAFGKNDGSKTWENLSYKELSVKFKVIAENIDGTVIRNEAAVTEDSDKDKNPVDDRDSQPESWPGRRPDHNYQDDEDYDNVILQSFDLALRKFIIAVSEDEEIADSEYLKDEDDFYTRAPSVDTSKLNTFDDNGKFITTATYNHTKEPIEVRKGDYVVYMLRVYNEGSIDGYAAEIKDHLPPYLEFVNGTFNQKYGWSVSTDGKTVTTKYLASQDKLIEKAELNSRPDNESEKYILRYQEVPILCRVTDEAKSDENITNIADITLYKDSKGETTDRDSEKDNVNSKEGNKPTYKDDEKGDYVPGQEDDDDFEKVVVKAFDLALRKFIGAVSHDEEITADEYLKKQDGSYVREPVVDTSKLNTEGANGEMITTATYNHTKEPLKVDANDYIVYILRVYNEGSLDGYAAEIKDHLPEYLEFVDGEFNEEYGWEVSEDGRTVTTKYLDSKDKIIGKAQLNENPQSEADKYTLKYQDVPILCRVKPDAKLGEKITNIADITIYKDEKGEPKDKDRDSEQNNVDSQEGNKPEYKDDEEGEYIPGQEDDDDFEKVIIKKFDLALRKFITKVNEKDVTTRIPQVSYENGKITYNHDKTPVGVSQGDTVIYTIRVFNEGEINGYASEVSDDIPEGLEFIPENETNKEYRWVMYDAEGKETNTLANAVTIVTDYLSMEQGKARMGEDDEENPALLKAFNPDAAISDTNPDYKDLKVAFKVIEPNSSDRVLVNKAQITDDTDENGNPVEDEDSKPGEWNEGEDDQDKEYVELQEFDLALRKWVTQAIVIENGKETVTQTGHQPYDDPEDVVKVEIHRKKINSVTVKFRYKIRVTNEGDIEGYAKEITDYVPNGLKFVAKDNPGWTDEGNNVISTRLLENTLLKPGEYAEVEVLLTWINGQSTMGVMTNTAEISEDYNDKDVPDKDSTPDNKKPKEDDIDDAPVMLSIGTGKGVTYFTLTLTILITLAGGVILIKKYVL